MRGILGIFAKSPFEAIMQHTVKVHECAQLVKPLFEALIEQDTEALDRLTKQISDTEHEADIIHAGISDHLPKRLFMPVDRGDILEFLEEQDSIADTVEDIAVLLNFKREPLPADLVPELMHLIDTVTEAVNLAMSATRSLEDLVGASFEGPKAHEVLTVIEAVGKQEWAADRVQNELAGKLFGLEDRLSPLSIWQWLQILRSVGEIADHAEQTANKMRLMLARA